MTDSKEVEKPFLLQIPKLGRLNAETNKADPLDNKNSLLYNRDNSRIDKYLYKRSSLLVALKGFLRD